MVRTVKEFLTSKSLRIFYLYLLIIFAFYVAFLAFKHPIKSNQIQIGLVYSVLDFYAHALMAGSKILLGLFGNTVFPDYGNNQLWLGNNGYIKLDYPFYGLKYVYILLIVVILTKATLLKRFSFALKGLSGLYILNCTRVALYAQPGQMANFSVYNPIFNTFAFAEAILVLLLIYQFWQQNPSVKNIFFKQLTISETQYKAMFKHLAIILTVFYITEILLFNNWVPIIKPVIQFLMHISQGIAAIFGYTAAVTERALTGAGAKVTMADSCMGIGLTELFAAFIFVLPGVLRTKIWFILGGVLAIFLFNSIRVALVFVHISDNNGMYALPFDIHDLLTYPVYIFTFLMWIIWINYYYGPKNKHDKHSSFKPGPVPKIALIK